MLNVNLQCYFFLLMLSQKYFHIQNTPKINANNNKIKSIFIKPAITKNLPFKIKPIF